ncbi:MAG: hypothetical protein WBN92_11455 [Terriglobia bacterium]
MKSVASKMNAPTDRHTPLKRANRLLKTSLIMTMGLILCATCIHAQLPVRTSSPFSIVGFIQAATLDAPGDVMAGGTLKVNGQVVTIPRNTLLEMPAATISWAELFALAPKPYGLGTGPSPVSTTQMQAQSGLAMADLPTPLTTFEVTVLGNRIIDPILHTDRYIAGLVFLAQQSLNMGQGHINFIDYTKGEIRVGGTINDPTTGTRVQINDPLGRFGLAHSPDLRFTIDEDNPTVHASSSYPMCIPRVAPTATAFDPLCPETNRPRDPATGNPQTVFNMPPPPPQINPTTDVAVITANPKPGDAPDSTRQMPFEVGDYVTFNGTLVNDPALVNPATGICNLPSGSTACPTIISAWNLVGSVGAFTWPGTLPAYVDIEVMLLGVAGDPNPLLPQEAVEKLVMIGFTTDFMSLVDSWAIDRDNCTGGTKDRYLVTGNPFGPPLGALKGRFKTRTVVGNFLPATREMRAVSRTIMGGAIYAGVFDSTTSPSAPGNPIPAGLHTYANGLLAGQYHAPNFTFVFPENLILGSPQVPLNLQDFGFLVNGEGPYFPVDATLFGLPANSSVSSGQLTPWPGNFNVTAGCGPGNVTKMPIPNAGAPRTVASGATVTLDGSASFDPNNLNPPLPLTYLWLQVAGPTVQLSDPTAVKPTFTAPIVPAGNLATTLAFDLAVNNGVGSSGIATTTVTVSPISNPPAGDNVTILSAVYKTSKSLLNVNATSSDQSGAAQLTLQIPNHAPVLMSNQQPLCLPLCAPNSYFVVVTGVNPIPASITVVSSEGGSATSRITKIK